MFFVTQFFLSLFVCFIYLLYYIRFCLCRNQNKFWQLQHIWVSTMCLFHTQKMYMFNIIHVYCVAFSAGRYNTERFFFVSFHLIRDLIWVCCLPFRNFIIKYLQLFFFFIVFCFRIIDHFLSTVFFCNNLIMNIMFFMDIFSVGKMRVTFKKWQLDLLIIEQFRGF